MSKVIKQMQMDALKDTFKDVRDMVVLSVKGLSAQGETQFRAALRKKSVRLQMVKNSFTRRVFGELGFEVPEDSPYWAGTTVLAWATNENISVSELSKSIDGELKGPKTAPLYKERVTVKGAIVDGRPMAYEQALKIPTRAEAIGRVVGLAMSAASRLVGQILGPAAGVAGQVKTKSEEKAEGGEGEPAAEAPAGA
jgi:large subunit ribosomal protein L10